MLLSSAAGDSPEASLYGWLTRANAGMNDYYWFSENREHWISGTLGTHTVSPRPNAGSVPYRIAECMYVLTNSTITDCLQGTRSDAERYKDTDDTILSSINLQ